jgi:2-iminobutanoate/2-iminopropanoate deaminase
MRRQVIKSEGAPTPIGPYNQAILVDGLVYTSGFIGQDPGTGKLVSGGIEAETRQVFENLSVVLGAAGSSLASVVKTTVFLTSLDNYAAMNAVYSGAFPTGAPARSTVEISGLALGALVEIEAVAVVG